MSNEFENIRVLFENAPVGIFQSTLSGQFVDMNQELVRMLGYSTKKEAIESIQSIQKDIYAIAEDREKIIAAISSKNEISSFELKIKQKDGRLLDVRLSIRPYTSNTANQTYIGIIEDITEFKKTQAKLLQNEIRYQTLFNQAADGIVVADQKGFIQELNDSICTISGYTKQEAMGKNIIDFFKPDELVRNPLRFDLLLQGKTVLNERQLISKNGIAIDIQQSTRLLPDGRIQTFIRDVSERKKNEQILSSIVNCLPFDIMVKDKDGNIIIQNKISKQFWGDLSDENNLIVERNKSENWKENKERVKRGETLDFEMPLLKKDGEMIDARRIITPFQIDDQEMYGAIFLNIDITEQNRLKSQLGHHLVNLELIVKKRTEEVLQLNDQLTKSNEELSYINEQFRVQNIELEAIVQELRTAQKQLVQSEKMASLGVLTAGIAHEINNPINFISSGVVGLKMEIESLIQAITEHEKLCIALNNCTADKTIDSISKHNDVARALTNIPKLIASINTGVERTITIIKGLRTFSRMDDENKNSASIKEIINSALTILYNKYKNKITIKTNFCENDTINCYSGKLGQLFLNLLSNAIHAIKQQGTIEMSTHYIDYKQGFEIRIKDSGEGIPSENQKRIYDPFFTTKSVGEGTGLGLSIVHGIVNDHNGEIKVLSEVGKGTEFILFLPEK